VLTRVTNPCHVIDSRSDQELIRALNAGDASAFDALYYRHRDWCVRLAYRFTRDHDDALDVLQETFAYLARKFPGFILTASMTTFLYPVVKNSALAVRRKRRRLVTGSEEAVEVPTVAPNEPEDPRDALAQVLARIPGASREVLLMRFVDGLKLHEIAEALGVPVGTVKSRLHNALETLRGDERMRNYFEAQ
jgi:RNA polymerase sigma-70 factor, ECF subfamily